MEERNGVRIDKWLWAARFFRTRSVAAAAVSSGHVQLNGTRVKPARLIRPGDRLRIRREEEVYEVEVLDVSERRLGASLVPTLWSESEESRRRRAVAREERRAAGCGVIPAKAGIQCFQEVAKLLDTGFHRCDDFLREHQD